MYQRGAEEVCEVCFSVTPLRVYRLLGKVLGLYLSEDWSIALIVETHTRRGLEWKVRKGRRGPANRETGIVGAAV